MRIRRVRLKNVGPHTETDWQMEPGVLGILGPNGAGKSTAVNAAYAALTNDYSRFEGGKKGAIRQQAPEDAESSIVVDVEHMGHDYRITRGLRPDKHRFELIGSEEKPLAKAGEIAVAIEEQIGITRALLDNYVFVAQWDMFAFLGLTEAERAKHFARLCGTTAAEARWEMIGKQLELDRNLSVSVVDTRDEIRQELAQSNTRKNKLAAEQVKAQEKILPEAEVEKLRQVGPARQRCLEAQRELPEAKQNEEELLGRAKKANTAVKNAEEALRKAQVALRKAQDAVDGQASEQVALQGQQRDNTAAEELRGELTDLLAEERDEPERPEELGDQTKDQLEEAVSAATLSLHTAEQLIEACGGETPECPTCGTATDDPRLVERLAEAERAVPRLEEQRKAARALVIALSQYEKRQRRYDMWSSSHGKDVGRIKKRLALLPAVDIGKVTERLEELLEVVQHRDAWREDTEAAEEDLPDLRQAKTTAITKHVAAKEKLKQLNATVQTWVSEVEAKVASIKLGKHDASSEAVAGLKSQIREITRSQAGAKRRLREMTAAIEQSQKGREWIAFLESARAVLHRDRLPAEVHKAVLGEMENGINEDLEDFGAPFYVKSNESLSFTAFFDDGTVMSANGLSGGEKVTLALPFRLQVNSMFASQVGMLVLDEPTAGLDEDHIEAVIEVFDQLRGMAKAQGFQIIVITHEKGLDRAFDQIYRVGSS